MGGWEDSALVQVCLDSWLTMDANVSEANTKPSAGWGGGGVGWGWTLEVVGESGELVAHILSQKEDRM